MIDTHIQADHLSGGRSLSKATGAQDCLHNSADVSFSFTAITDEQELDLTLAFRSFLHHRQSQKRWNSILNLNRSAFVERLANGIPANPAEMLSTLRMNRGRA